MRKLKSYISTQLPRRACLALLYLLSVSPVSSSAAEPPGTTLRIGFTSTMFTNVNENDAKAAMKVWGKTVAHHYDLPVEPEPMIFKNLQDLQAALQNKTIDIVGASTLEYETLQRELNQEHIFVAATNQEVSEEYVLVVHRNGSVKSLKDLAGRRILFHQHIRLCLAPLWLDNLLLQRGLQPADSFAGDVTRKNNLSQVLLPVFFKQADACVINRRGLETITELNPQLGQQLMILETSAKMVTAVFAFRRDYSPPFKEALLEGLRTLHETAEGRQVLLVFQCDQITEKSRPVLSSALELISSYSRAVGQ